VVVIELMNGVRIGLRLVGKKGWHELMILVNYGQEQDWAPVSEGTG
jgi:hypothetical protein